MLAGVIIWGIGLALLPSAHPVAVPTVLGLFMGLPVGVIMALPAEVLHPASRAIGTGLFYTGLYIGHAGLPPLAGWLQDLSGDAAVSLYFAGALVVLILPLFAAFRLRQGRSAPGAPARPG